MQYIKIFGKERVGTNYLEEILKQNFNNIEVLTNQFGWKHGYPNFTNNDLVRWFKYRCNNIDKFKKLRQQIIENGQLHH